ncbi:hypothetical protein [Lysinibacter cavernae]|uniref:hypothetical protein n=1 Tax=Lysinibacter cavernae TaxID=1640652 RepID=UPI00361D7EB7
MSPEMATIQAVVKTSDHHHEVVRTNLVNAAVALASAPPQSQSADELASALRQGALLIDELKQQVDEAINALRSTATDLDSAKDMSDVRSIRRRLQKNISAITGDNRRFFRPARRQQQQNKETT